MIIVAHRLSTLKRVDKIFVMEGGKITQSGSYEELSHSSKSLFSELVEIDD